jgi:hypothetical protein
MPVSVPPADLSPAMGRAVPAGPRNSTTKTRQTIAYDLEPPKSGRHIAIDIGFGEVDVSNRCRIRFSVYGVTVRCLTD